MAKVITVSRKFPAYHERKTKPTFFVEQILKQQGINHTCDNYLQMLCELNKKNLDNKKLSFEDIESFAISLQNKEDEKSHTIRNGRRWKIGDMASFRCWFGKPYNSPQIVFLPDIEIKKIWNIEIEMPIRKLSVENEEGVWWQYDKGNTIEQIAQNDGLELEDFWNWFPKSFKGQIICWGETISY